ncbi:hypothetical protein V5O48_010393 [Marasmius crinis-equi]|uniref:Uncharacterized protein n=1 Tax=Marasmius crinis-equi TaxID=585013 RepID=A0ABR3F942_9AGAR
MSTIVTVIGETCLWAIYLVLFFWAVGLQVSHKAWRNPTLPRIAVLSVTVFLFLSSTALWTLNLSWLILGAKVYFMNTQKGVSLLTVKEMRDEQLLPLALPMELLFCTNMVFGDAVVIWRAWVISRGTRLHSLVWVPMIMLLSSVGFIVFAMNCLAAEGWTGSTTIPIGSRVCKWAEPIAWGISLITNLISTMIIAVRAWKYRRFLREGRLNTSRFRAHRILIMLVESGFIYCISWLTQVVIFLEIQRGYKFIFFLRSFLYPLGDQIPGIYSTLIIIVVHMKRSINDVGFVAPSSASAERESDPPSNTLRLSTLMFTSHSTMRIDPEASDVDMTAVERNGIGLGTIQMDQK